MRRTADRSTAYERLAAKLRDPRASFTADQVAFLMATSSRWAAEAVEGEPSELSFMAGWDDGYRARVAEENAPYPPPPIAVGLDRWISQVDYRRRCDADTRQPRENDYHGGPVPVWGPNRCDDTDPHDRHRVEADDDAGHGRFVCPGAKIPAIVPMLFMLGAS